MKDLSADEMAAMMMGGPRQAKTVPKAACRGGDVVLESELGLGTTVRIFLPLKLRQDAKDPSAN